MGTKAWLAVLAAVAVILAVGAWLQLRPAPTPTGRAPVAMSNGGAIATTADIDALKARASAACRCARANRNSDCWGEFDRNLARYRHEEMVSACGAESSVSICFDGPAGADGRCIARPGPGSACDEAEARSRARPPYLASQQSPC